MDKNGESALSTPPEWKERFLIKRIGEDNIEITLDERNQILRSFNNGDQYIQIGKYTLMLNSIKSIDPFYEPDNIPPCPKSDCVCGDGGQVDKNAEAIEVWNHFYRLRNSGEQKKLE